MLKNKQVIYHIKRGNMRNIYITTSELLDLLGNLTPNEVNLYTVLKHSLLINPQVDYFSDDNLAKEINVTPSSIKKMKSVLKTKGYALISKFKDENQNPMVRVVVGKEQIALYNAGLMVEITDASAYNQMIKKYDLLNPSLTEEQRKELVAKINKEYSESESKRSST